MSPSLAELRARLPELTLRDEFRLRRRLDGVRGSGVPAALTEEIEKAAARARKRRAAIPAVSYPSELPVSRPQGRHPGRDPGPPGRRHRRRDRLGQDHPAAEDLPGARPRHARHDRPHPAAPDRRPHGRRADRRGARRRARRARSATRSGSPTGPASDTAGQADDRRHPAGRDPARPDAAPVRHDHHRRGARAQPEHRLPARLPQAAAAPPARPQADHHLGHHRPAAVRPALRRRAGASRSPAGRIRSRSATARCGAEDDDEDATRSTAISAAVDELGLRGARRRAGLPLRRAGDPRHRGGAAPRTCRTAPRSCRCSPGCPRPTSTRSSRRTPAGGSCWPPTSPRPR